MRPARQSYESPELVPTRAHIEHPYKPGRFLPVHKRHTRLAGVDYASPESCCFVTFNLLPGNVALTGEIGATALQTVLHTQARIGFRLHAACMMPDHFHLLLNPSGQGESVADIVGRMKKCLFFDVRDGHREFLRFQEGFWDHVLGREQSPDEEFEAIVWYIRQNPVAAGLVERAEDYPFLL